MRYIVSALDELENVYLTPRRPTDVYGESRSSWSENFEDAKVFNTKSAAVRSLRASRYYNENITYTIQSVAIMVIGK